MTRFCVWRSDGGTLCATNTTDDGATWSEAIPLSSTVPAPHMPVCFNSMRFFVFAVLDYHVPECSICALLHRGKDLSRMPGTARCFLQQCFKCSEWGLHSLHPTLLSRCASNVRVCILTSVEKCVNPFSLTCRCLCLKVRVV